MIPFYEIYLIATFCKFMILQNSCKIEDCQKTQHKKDHSSWLFNLFIYFYNKLTLTL